MAKSPSPSKAFGRDWAGMARLHGAVLLFGLVGLFGKWVPAHPILIVFARVLVASAAFVVLLRWSGAPKSRPGVRDGALLMGCGALLAFHWFAFFHAIQVSTVAIGLLGVATFPVFAALLEPVWFRERFSWRSLACALACVGGVSIIAASGEGGPGDVSLRAGMFWGVLAGFSFAVLSLLNRGLTRRHAPIRIAFYQDAAALVCLAPLLPWVWRPLEWGEAGLLVVLGLFCTALPHTLFIGALRTVKVQLAAIASALEPVYGITLAWLLLAETPPARVLAGGAVILAAVLLASLERSGESPPCESTATP